jgi:hypothetical protein
MDQEIETQQPELEQEQPEEVAAPALFDDEDQESEAPESAGEAATEVPAGEEGQQQSENSAFRKLRGIANAALKDKRRLEREMEDLRAKLPKPEPVAITSKPTLDQYDYDETRFSEAYDNWMEQKAKLDAADRAKLDAQRKEQEDVENFKKSYAARKESLGVADFEEAESEVGSILNQTQAGLLMRGADDPAVLVYALSKSPARLIELSKIADPVKFTVAVAKLEISLATKKTTRPAPEARVTAERGTGFNATSSQLDKLRAEAERTGDYSKVVQYKKQMQK